jgi:hypothetical protein
MQGISQSKHQHLMDALLHLENLLNTYAENDADIQQAIHLRSELGMMHQNYCRQLDELFGLINDYHELFNKSKAKFLSPKLKELRKQMVKDTKVISFLTESIRMVYGT